MGKTIVMLALTLTLVYGAPVLAQNKRNPFELPPAAESLYRYDEAIQQVKVQGIVQTETASHVIIRILDGQGLTVLRAGENFAFKFNSVRHIFRVGEIGLKSVRFHAGKTGQKDDHEDRFESKGFEVFIQ